MVGTIQGRPVDARTSAGYSPAVRLLRVNVQQDSEPAHRARETVHLLTKETPNFIPPTLWLPNSPDLNPVDYKVWSVMQEKVYKKWIKDVDELRSRILTA